MNGKKWVAVGAVLMALGIIIGAFGAHSIQDLLVANDSGDIFATGSKYHLIHGLAIILLGLIADRFPHRFMNPAGWLFLVGILLFSFSLYVLSITGIRMLGMITPFGGVSLIIAWSLIAIAGFQSTQSGSDR